MGRGRVVALWSRIPRGAVLLSLISVGNVLVGFMREGVIAYYFGTSGDLDAFLVANTIPRVLVGQAVQITVAIVLPLYVDHLENGRAEAATTLLRRWFVFLLQMTTALCVVLVVAARPLVAAIGNGLSSDQIHRATRWMWWMLLYLWLVSITGCFKVVLDRNRRFYLPALWTGMVSVSVMVSCVVGAASLGVSALIPGFVVGAALAFLFQWWQCRTLEPRLLSLRRLPMKVSLPIVGAGIMAANALVQQANLIIDRGFASQLPDGSIAALNYANAVVLVPQTIVPVALATTLFPHLAEMEARGSWRAAYRSTLRWSGLLALVSLPAAAVVSMFRHELVELLFQRGQFDDHAASMTVDALQVLLFNVVVTSADVLVIRLLLARRQHRAVLLTTALGVLTKVAVNLLLVSRFGLAGIAAATVIAGAASTSVRFWFAGLHRPAVTT